MKPTDAGVRGVISRRQFLKSTGSGIFLYFTLGEVPFEMQEGRRASQLPTADFNAFLRIGADGRAACFTGKIEMGQGPITSLAQMLAEELDVPFDTVDMVMGDTDLCPFDRGTYGSLTTRVFGPSLRAAGAEARQVLVELASDHLKVPVATLAVNRGVVYDRGHPERRVSYADLAGGKRIERHLSGRATLKSPEEFTLIGKPMLRVDARDKVTGKARYAGDIQLPGMLYAKLLRPPSHGATLADLDLTEAQRMKDVQILHEGDFVAVLHRHPDVAELALSKIKAAFSRPASGLDDANIFEHLLKVAPEGKVVAQGGNLQEGERATRSVLESTFFDGYVAHAPMEPHTAVARVDGDKVTIWASTQTPFPLREEVARELGVPQANVRVIPPFVGGGFGGKTRNQQAVEAARCAKLCGKPVQVAWTRKEEFFYDSFRPAAVVKIRSGITPVGKIGLWDYHVYFAGERGAAQFYDIPHHSTVVHNSSWVGAAGSHPFATGPWRAPANNTNTFARESQIDLMAAKAGVDPVEFRLQNLTDQKMQRVLRAAAEKFGWRAQRSPSGRGVGVACGIDAGTYVALIGEADVDKTSGAVRMTRVVCAQDMGLVVNPEGATIQVEGCVTMGLGYALREHIRFKDGEIFDLNFDTYEIPRFSWLPIIETVLIDDRNAPPQGGGEPAIVVMGALVANAIHDAIGVRLFRLPMTPERVKEALKK